MRFSPLLVFLSIITATLPTILINSSLTMRLLLIVSLLTLSVCSSAKEKVIKIATGEYSPWISATSKHQGFGPHIISEVFNRAGYKCLFIFYPWARAIKEAETGKYHATASWTYSKKREKHFYHSDALWVENVVFFHLKTTNFQGWDTLENLTGYRIGTTRGYTYSPEFWGAQKAGKLNIILNNSDKINFYMLLKGRIDLFPSSIVTGYSLLSKNFHESQIAKLTYNKKPLLSPVVHMLFPIKKEESLQLLNLFNSGLQSLREDGTYDKLYDRLLGGYYNQP